MSNLVTGVVSNIEGRNVTTRFGPKTSYNVTVDGQRYAAGFKKPDVNVGDFVSFEHKGDSYRTVIGSFNKPGGMPVVAPGSAAIVPPMRSAPSYSGGRDKPFPLPPLHGDRSIVRQNALTQARELVCVVLASYKDKMVEFKGSQADLDNVASEIIRLARKFEAYAAGDLDREAAEMELMAAKAVEE